MLKYMKRISVECAYRLRLKTGGEWKNMKTCIIQPPYSRDVSFSDEYFQYKLKLYLEMQEKDPIKVNFFNIAFLIQNIIIIICFYYQKEIEKINSSVNILLNMACLSSCSYLLFTQIPAFSVRISEVFNCGLIILIPLITRAFKPKALAEALVVIIGFFFFYIYVFHSEIVRDYKFIWSW